MFPKADIILGYGGLGYIKVNRTELSPLYSSTLSALPALHTTHTTEKQKREPYFNSMEISQLKEEGKSPNYKRKHLLKVA